MIPVEIVELKDENPVLPIVVRDKVKGIQIKRFESMHQAESYVENKGAVVADLHTILLQMHHAKEAKDKAHAIYKAELQFKAGEPLIFTAGVNPNFRAVLPAIALTVDAYLPDLIAEFHIYTTEQNIKNQIPPEQNHGVDYFITWLVMTGKALKHNPVHIQYNGYLQVDEIPAE